MEVNHYACVERVTLQNLTPNKENALIVGIMIAKQPPWPVNVKTTDNRDRAVWKFTFRDSPQDYINVTCWGEKSYVFELCNKFQVGDVVEIVKPKVEIRKINDYGEQFCPMVTSPYSLTLVEHSEIRIYEGSNHNVYLKLIRLPTKPLASFVALADVHRKGSSNAGAHGLDLLGAVSFVGNIRNVTTRNGLEQVREVVIFDHTNPGIRFSIWNRDLFVRANSWQPRNTILFLTDMRAQWSSFYRCTIAIVTSRTIITEDPVGPEADALRKYAQNAGLHSTDLLENITTSIPDANTIQNVMSIKQILDKINYTMCVNMASGDEQFTALIFAMVTALDLDGTINPVSIRCASCHMPIRSEQCGNGTCPGSSAPPYEVFDIRVSITDHTGTWDNCRLTRRAAESALGYTVQQFLKLDGDERGRIKWRYLLERCAVRILVSPLPGKQPLFSIISLSLAAPYEVASKLPHC